MCPSPAHHPEALPSRSTAEEARPPHSTAAIKNSSPASVTSQLCALGQVNLHLSGQKWPHPKISIQIENEPALWVVVATIECLAL